MGWPLPEDLIEEELQRKLLNTDLKESSPPAEPTRALPQWPEVHKELAHRGVTLRLLWQDYRQQFAEGYGYTQFCEYYHRWSQTLDPVLRHMHAPGEEMFVDWRNAIRFYTTVMKAPKPKVVHNVSRGNSLHLIGAFYVYEYRHEITKLL